jgi:hypothetical protein
MIVTLTEEGKTAAEKGESGETELAGIFDCLNNEEKKRKTLKNRLTLVPIPCKLYI